MKHWKDRVQDIMLPADVDALALTIKSIFFDLEQGQAIDFRGLNMVNGMHLATALRATWRPRELYPHLIVGWDEALISCEAALIEQVGANSAKGALYGLK